MHTRSLAAVIALLVTLATGGCDGAAACESPCRSDSTDAGPAPLDAAGPASDASPDPDVRDASSSDAGVAPPMEDEFSADTCHNGLDDDANGLADCAERSCGVTAYCCLGTTSAACCEAPVTRLTRRFTDCETDEPLDCIAGATRFGGPFPVLEAGAFVPHGDDTSDSGIVLGDTVDPTRDRITLSAQLAAGTLDCGGASGCLDVIALGLAEPPALGPSRVVADVAVVVRASRGDYALVVAGEVLATRPLLTTGAQLYTLELAPDGALRLEVAGEVTEATYLPRPGRAPLLYGRTHNRTSASEPARALDVAVATSTCEVLDSWTRATGPMLPPPGEWGGQAVSSPSVARLATSTLAAFEVGTAIHLARLEDVGGWSLLGGGSIDAPVLTPPPGEAYSDPELVVEADRVAIYFTHMTGTRRTLLRAEGGEGFGEIFDAPVEVQLPERGLDGVGRSFWSPSVVGEGASRRLAALTDVEGVPKIVLMVADSSGATFAYAGADLASSVIASPRDGFAYFDDDEVSDPELVIDDEGLLRLYYAGRRGSRWGIGLLVSADQRTWRDPTEGRAILRGSGEGHDTMWVRDPSVLIEEGLSLFHTGYDGAIETVARAEGALR